MRLGQYARAVDQALRPLLVGRDVLLVLGAASPMDSIYRQWNTYPHLAAITLSGNPENEAPRELAARAREVLDQAHAAELAEVRETFEARVSQGRAKTDVADVASAATFGMVETLFVDIDAELPGTIDESTGSVTFADGEGAQSYGIVDEIARRTWLAGGQVLAVRRQDIPDAGDVAAILRWSLDNG